MKFNKIRLELARNPEFPEGSSEFGYEIVAPLDGEGHLDLEAWRSAKEKCTIRRFWRRRDDEHGLLVHKQNGWIFDYDPDAEDDDEPLFRLDEHIFKPGEYVSVTEHDGVQRTFQVVSVD